MLSVMINTYGAAPSIVVSPGCDTLLCFRVACNVAVNNPFSIRIFKNFHHRRLSSAPSKVRKSGKKKMPFTILYSIAEKLQDPFEKGRLHDKQAWNDQEL